MRGYYVNRLLVNYIAIWASAKYVVYIFQLLDNIAKEERNELEHKVNTLTETVHEQKPLLVPKSKEKNYKYLIWKENDDEIIMLHFIRRNRRAFSQVNQHFKVTLKIYR